MSSLRHYQIKPSNVKSPPLAARLIHYKHLGLSVCLGMSLIIILKLLFLMALSEVLPNIASYKEKQFSMAFQGQIDQAQLSFNAENIIYSAKPSNEEFYQIYIKSLTENRIETMPKRLTTTEQHFWLINKANKSNKIAYIAETKKECGIYTANLYNSNSLHEQQKLASCEQYHIRDIAWSHNSHYLYFLAKDKIDEKRILPNQDKHYQIYQIELKNHTITRFSKHDDNILSLSTSPDGQWLSTVNIKDEITWQVSLYNIATKEKKQLLSTGLHINDISWLSDSKNILLATSEGPKNLALTGEVQPLLPENIVMHTKTGTLSANSQLLLNNKSWLTTFWQFENPITSSTQNNRLT